MSNPQKSSKKRKTVTCDYCKNEYPKYSWGEDGLRREFAPKLPNGLRRCAYCTAGRFINDVASNAHTKDGIRRDKMLNS